MLNIAVIGPGGWGTLLAKAIKDQPDLMTIVGNLARTRESSTKFQGEFGGKIYDAFDDVLADDAVQAVVLCTPHSTHRDFAVAAAKAGKHVFVEKPLTLDVAGARDIVAACEESGVVLAVGFNRRFFPAIRKMKEMIDNDDVGQIIHVEANMSANMGFRLKQDAWRADPSEAPNAAFTPMGIHIVDAFTWLAGPTERLVSISKHLAIPLGELDDTCSVLFELKNGGTGFVASHSAVPRSAYLHIQGTKCRLEANNLTQVKVVPAEAGQKPEVLEFPNETSTIDEMAAFAKACAGEADYVVTPTQALHSVAFLEAIGQSAKSNRWVQLATS